MDTPDALEKRITELWAAIRAANADHNATDAAQLHAELNNLQILWDHAVTPAPPPSLLSAREQVAQVLDLVAVPAPLRLVATIGTALFDGSLNANRLTSLRRDERRSFTSATAHPSRVSYVCSALTAGTFAPARGLLALSTWPLERRMITPTTPPTTRLETAAAIAEHLRTHPHPTPRALALLRSLARHLPHISDPGDPAAVATVVSGLLTDSTVRADELARHAAARAAKRRLTEAELLFGRSPAAGSTPAQ